MERTRVKREIDITNQHEGIYLITKSKNSKSYKEILIKLYDLPTYVDMQNFIKSVMLEDIIVYELAEKIENKDPISYQQIAEHICRKIYEKYQIKYEQKQKIKDRLKNEKE